MTSYTIEDLILDTLYYRRTNTDGSCLSTNIAGEELLLQSSESLPKIEHVIGNVVAPAFLSQGESTFLGLTHVLGAYLLIGLRVDIPRVVRFLQRLPAALQAEAISVIPVFFSQTDVECLGKPPSDQLILFLKQLEESDDSILRDAAKRAMSSIPESYSSS